MLKVSVTANTKGLDALIKANDRICSPARIAEEAQASVPMVESLYVLGFERTESPAGKRWAPPKHDYGHPLMRDTRDLQNGSVVTAEPDGVRIVVNIEYAEYHQDGTPRMVARKIVPEGPLGDRWERQIALARTSVPFGLP